MRWWHIFLITLLAYLLSLIYLIPAKMVYQYFKGSVPNEIVLDGVKGELWSGTVEKFSYQGSKIGRLQWELQPMRILIGELSFKTLLQSHSGHLQGEIALSYQQKIVMKGVSGNMPVDEITQLFPFIPLMLKGIITIDIDRVVADIYGRLLDAKGELLWHQAKMISPASADLGSIVLTIQPDSKSQGLDALLNGSQGDILLNGKANLNTLSGAFQWSGHINPEPAAQRRLQGVLRMLGRPNRQGEYPFQGSGKLPGYVL